MLRTFTQLGADDVTMTTQTEPARIYEPATVIIDSPAQPRILLLLHRISRIGKEPTLQTLQIPP